MTIVDVMKMHRSEEKGDVKDMSCERYEDWRVRIPPILNRELKMCHLKCLKVCCSQVCSCCAMRSLYFTWHNVCSVCRRSDHSLLWFCAWWNCFVTFILCVRRVVCPGCCLEVGGSLLCWIFRCHKCRLAVNLHVFPLSDASALKALREPSSELLQANRDERWAKPEELLERALDLEFSLVSRWYQLNQ